MTTHPFDAALELQTVTDDRLRGRTHPAWKNVVGPFGGITAAILLRAIECQPDRIGDPLALTVNFAAPIQDGEFDVGVQRVLTSRTTQHWSSTLSQGVSTRCTATAVFATRRETWADSEAPMPTVPTPEDIPVTPPAPEFADWLTFYEMRLIEGAPPASPQDASPTSRTTMWIRDAGARGLDHAALATLCDMFYPRIFLRRGGFVPAGTVSMTCYFHATAAQLAQVGDEHVLASAGVHAYSGGYFDQQALLWSRHGHLLATSHQVVYFKA